MEISEQLLCLFSEQIRERNGSYLIEVPERELTLGELQEGEVYRVALSSTATDSEAVETESETGSPEEGPNRTGSPPEPPVEEGDTRDVEIEDLGEQGDGITRVERGYVVIVPDTEPGERVTIRITDVRENVAFAEVMKRLSF